MIFEAQMMLRGCALFIENTEKESLPRVRRHSDGSAPDNRKAAFSGAYDSMSEKSIRECAGKMADDCDRSKILSKEAPLIIVKDFRDEMSRWRSCRRAGRPGSGPGQEVRSNHVSQSGAAMAERRVVPMVPPASRGRPPLLRLNAMPDGSRHGPAADAGAP